MEATGQTAAPADAAPQGQGLPRPDAARHANAFGFLRLLFASLVIVSHFPQLVDGNAKRELLYSLTGTVGLGGLSVDGFFLISGYLVVSSFCNQPTVVAYLARRLARIVPGFVLACLFCLLVVAPLAGVDYGVIAADWRQHIATTLILHEPMVPQAFAGTHYPVMNGSMWTIIHEFRCYLVVIVLGLLGAFRWRWSVPVISALLFLGYEVVSGHIGAPELRRAIIAAVPVNDADNALRFTGIFLVGSTFYLFRQQIALRPRVALMLAVPLVAIMTMRSVFHPGLLEPAFAVLGGYVIFTTAFCVTTGPLARINTRTDISYGVYLYAWPVAKLLLWYWPDMPVALGIAINFALACALGWASWHLIEKRAAGIFTRKRAAPAIAAPAKK
ncbi:MAG: acyltransferase family protein [Novosphingobium sp.]